MFAKTVAIFYGKVGVAELGVLAGMANLVALVADGNVGQAMLRLSSALRGENAARDREAIRRAANHIAVSMSLMICLAVVVIQRVWPESPLSGYASLAGLFTVLAQVQMYALSSGGQSIKTSVVSVVRSAITTLTVFLAALATNLSIQVAYTVAMFLGMIVTLSLSRNRTAIRIWEIANRSVYLTLMRGGALLTMSTLSSTGVRLALPAIVSLTGTTDGSQNVIAALLLGTAVFSPVTALVYQVLIPDAASHPSSSPGASQLRLLRVMVGVSVIGLMVSIPAPLLLRLAFDGSFNSATQTFRLVLAGSLARSATQVQSGALFALSGARAQFAPEVLGGAVTLVLVLVASLADSDLWTPVMFMMSSVIGFLISGAFTRRRAPGLVSTRAYIAVLSAIATISLFDIISAPLQLVGISLTLLVALLVVGSSRPRYSGESRLG